MAQKVSIFKKLLFANLVYAVPVVILVGQMYQAKTGNIDFGRWEEKGNHFQRPAENFLHSLLQRRTFVGRQAAGGEVSEASLREWSDKVDSSFAAMGESLKDVGDDLQFTEEGLGKRNRAHLKLSAIKGRWDDLKTKEASMSSADRLVAYAKLIADARGLIAHAGDTSNLILDPDLDSYYLMDITLLALPQMQDRLQDITVTVESLLRRGKMTAQDRVDVAVMGALLKQSDLDRVTADAQTVLTEDPNFYGVSPTLKKNLDAATESLAADVGAFHAMLVKIADASQPLPSMDLFIETSQKAQEASFAAWDLSVNELDALLALRISALLANRMQSIVFAALALLASCGFLFWIARSFLSNMTKVLSDLRETLGHTRSSSRAMTSLSDGLATSASDQASALQETMSAIEEIRSMVEKTRDATTQSARIAELSHTAAESGRESVRRVTRAIEDIVNGNAALVKRVEEGNQQIGDVTKIISEIAQKTKVINDIVFQTKLLSFNASVEAARAGEHGKGFAVVAEEVGNLAQMSGTAAKEIESMLESGITRVSEITSKTRSEIETLAKLGFEKTRIGSDVARQADQSLEEIYNRVEETKEGAHEIAVAADEQSKGIGEITVALQRLDQIAHNASKMAQETLGHSKGLDSQSQQIGSIATNLEEEVLGRKVGVKNAVDESEHAETEESETLRRAA